MATFRNAPEEWNRLDFQLLKNGACHLYSRSSFLGEDAHWLERHDYKVARFDCAAWTDEAAMHRDLAKVLAFPDYYGHNLDALNDTLSEALDSEGTCLVLCLIHFDGFAHRAPRVAHVLLDIIETNSRRSLLWGARLLALLHSGDPNLSLGRVGGTPVMWNPREYLRSSRRPID